MVSRIVDGVPDRRPRGLVRLGRRTAGWRPPSTRRSNGRCGGLVRHGGLVFRRWCRRLVVMAANSGAGRRPTSLERQGVVALVGVGAGWWEVGEVEGGE